MTSQIKEMLDKAIIKRSSNSPWLAPPVLIKKKMATSVVVSIIEI